MRWKLRVFSFCSLTPLLLALVVVVVEPSLLGCNAIFGVDDLTYSASDSGIAPDGGAGGDGQASQCGDGIVQNPPEECDDKNQSTGDGCEQCVIQPGYACSGAPSQCSLIQPQVVTQGPGLTYTIFDDAYDGGIESMTCVELTVPDSGYHQVQRVEVDVGMDHDPAGHLVIKLRSPQGTVTTLLSRPRFTEAADDGDETGGGCQAALQADGGVLTFADSSSHDAEGMGDSCNTNAVVCVDGGDGPCDYHPNPGAGPGKNKLADFNGENPVGPWRLCVGDSVLQVGNGRLDYVQLRVLSW